MRDLLVSLLAEFEQRPGQEAVTQTNRGGRCGEVRGHAGGDGPVTDLARCGPRQAGELSPRQRPADRRRSPCRCPRGGDETTGQERLEVPIRLPPAACAQGPPVPMDPHASHTHVLAQGYGSERRGRGTRAATV